MNGIDGNAAMTSPPSIRLKRAYDPPARADGRRVLVDRVWPRGLTKERLRLDTWLKEVAPSAKLRQWFDHDPAKWDAVVADARAAIPGVRAREVELRVVGVLGVGEGVVEGGAGRKR